MREIFKKMYRWIIKLFETLTSLFNIICFGRPFSKQPQVPHEENRVTILANGPSAKEIIEKRPELLTSCDLLAMNDAATSAYFQRLSPNYYILLDPAYFGAPLKGDPNYWKVVERVYNSLESVSWKMTLFLPMDKRASIIVNRFSTHKYIKIARYSATRIKGFDWFQMWAYRRGMGVPSSRNIIIPALLIMMNLGYNTIYLYGAEFSWTKTMDVDENNGRIYINDRHFYKNEEKRYLNKGSYIIWLRSISEMLMGLEQVGKYAKSKDITVINRTRGSFIETFPFEDPMKL